MNYEVHRVWLQMKGAPYPVEGYIDTTSAGWLPGFERDGAEIVAELINRQYPLPVFEWEAGDLLPTELGDEMGLHPVFMNRTVTALPPLYWFRTGDWTVVEGPTGDDFHLEFQSREDPTFLVYGSGPTLIQALASLEQELIRQCSLVAAFHEHCCFLTRDVTSIVDDLSAIGGVFDCGDFSAPEESFIIRRVPWTPADESDDPLGRALEELRESVRRLEKAMKPNIKTFPID